MSKFPYNHLSVLVMPTDYCNMNCVYCFNSRRTHEKKKIMSIETLRKIFEITIPHYDEINFIWHGGEPTSVGKEFYLAAIEMQKEYNKRNVTIENRIQTNLTMLDDEFVDFLLTNKFRIGSSFDGTQNEYTRHNTKRILAGRKLIVKHGGRVGFICVMQSKNVDHLIEDYEWFKENRINYTLNQYMATPPYEQDELYVTDEHYIKKICEFFDYWMGDKACNIKISYFDDFINYILFGTKVLCSYNSCLGKHVGIHYDGQIFNCNRDFPVEYSFGNVYDYEDIHECFESSGFQNLVKKAIDRRNDCKEKCDIYDFCAGGCNSSAFMGGNLSRGNEHTCRVISSVYHYIKDKLEHYTQATDVKHEKELNPYLVEKLIKLNDSKKVKT